MLVLFYKDTPRETLSTRMSLWSYQVCQKDVYDRSMCENCMQVIDTETDEMHYD